MKITLIALLGIICYQSLPISCDPIAWVGDSQIVGRTARKSDVESNEYLGVPYAEPPVGDLRFMKTKPIVSMPKVLNATHEPPSCHQHTTNPFPWYFNGTQKSEDCLYLNIWTPTDASPDNTKAVMYWIHGGGFRFGSIRDELYTGIALAALGDIVVVTVNYRLGPFGFLSFGTENAPGNAGLWDVLEGLRWVNQNIRAFGGDPARITIAGESAGSFAVGMLSASPLSQGLFARRIMQSGSPSVKGFKNYKNLNRVYAKDIAKLTGCANETHSINDHPSEVIQCLKNVDAITLSKMDSLILPRSRSNCFPQYGDELIPTKFHFGTQKEESLTSDLFIGVTKDEGSLFLATSLPQLFGFFGEKNPRINKTTGREIMRKMFPAYPQLKDLVDNYLPETLPENAHEEVTRQLYTALGDMVFFCPSVYRAERSGEKGNNVYFYMFVYRPKSIPWAQWTGVPHYSEVQFIFGQPVLNPKTYPLEEVDVSLEMIQMWSNFVKDGIPSAGWPLYRKDSLLFTKIGLGTDTDFNDGGPHRKNCDLLRPYFDQ